MKVDLSKDDLITLVRGNSPGHALMEKEPYKSCGNYSGSYGTWDWMNDKLRDLSEEKLYTMHVQMKYQYQKL